MAPPKATLTIPHAYRIAITTIEPILTLLLGVPMMLIAPGFYLSGLTRASLTTIQPATQFVYTQLAGGWLYIAFSEMLVLRFVDDVRVWKWLCAGILLSDALYTHSIAQAAGGWVAWAKVGEWNGQDWMVTVTTWPFVLIRVAVVLGIGLRKEEVKSE